MKIYAKTDIGCVRNTNQDNFACNELDPACAYAMVCDGMGGHAGGNIASDIAVKTISGELDKSYDNVRRRTTEKILASAIIRANDSVFAASLANSELKGMGTTVALVFILDSEIYIAHVGDSRVYGVDENKRIELLTKDHSVVQEMIDSGEITERESYTHPYKHIITRSIGISADIKVDVASCERKEFRRLLICSDGLSNLVTSADIERIMNDADVESIPEKLIAMAKDRGGTDNITAVVIDNEDGGAR